MLDGVEATSEGVFGFAPGLVMGLVSRRERETRLSVFHCEAIRVKGNIR